MVHMPAIHPQQLDRRDGETAGDGISAPIDRQAVGMRPVRRTTGQRMARRLIVSGKFLSGIANRAKRRRAWRPYRNLRADRPIISMLVPSDSDRLV